MSQKYYGDLKGAGATTVRIQVWTEDSPNKFHQMANQPYRNRWKNRWKGKKPTPWNFNDLASASSIYLTKVWSSQHGKQATCNIFVFGRDMPTWVFPRHSQPAAVYGPLLCSAHHERGAVRLVPSYSQRRHKIWEGTAAFRLAQTDWQLLLNIGLNTISPLCTPRKKLTKSQVQNQKLRLNF